MGGARLARPAFVPLQGSGCSTLSALPRRPSRARPADPDGPPVSPKQGRQDDRWRQAHIVKPGCRLLAPGVRGRS